jgi:hypothetical protein
MKIITISSADGRLIRDPASGREITGPTRVDGDDGFWIRRIAAGDVVIVREQAPDQQKSAAKELK